jgi:hypothetical protein
MAAMQTPDGSFTPPLLLAIGLLVISALLTTRMKDPQREEMPDEKLSPASE